MLIYGFLGLDNNYGNADVYDVYDVSEGYVVNKGFGTAKVVTTTTKGSIGVCSADPGSTSSCNVITSISGSTAGEFGYQGPCATTPMWDLCEVSNYGVVNYAPIAGTWTLKYNKSMTSKGDTAAQEDAIKAKLGWASATRLDASARPRVITKEPKVIRARSVDDCKGLCEQKFARPLIKCKIFCQRAKCRREHATVRSSSFSLPYASALRARSSNFSLLYVHRL